ncbi:hypothetical protein [Methylobacterium isbiliense]|uniref:hypothetical protein n=1 Tax=Methylobacterium isbiliense TaxID=315478 RepID=UPI001EE2AB5B|nr:hypothetical protein [Methylobacterium isbiliense]
MIITDERSAWVVLARPTPDGPGRRSAHVIHHLLLIRPIELPITHGQFSRDALMPQIHHDHHCGRRSIRRLSLGFPVTRHQNRQTEAPLRHIRAIFRHMTLTIVINKNQSSA